MRRIGVLGGMSWESTAEYYRLLNEITANRLGGLHSADLLVRAVDFAEIEEMQASAVPDDPAALRGSDRGCPQLWDQRVAHSSARIA